MHWPTVGTAHIALSQIRTASAGRGHGRTLHEAVLTLLRTDPALHTVRLGIASSNAEVAAPFWRTLGYIPTGASQPFPEGEADAITEIWARPLR